MIFVRKSRCSTRRSTSSKMLLPTRSRILPELQMLPSKTMSIAYVNWNTIRHKLRLQCVSCCSPFFLISECLARLLVKRELRQRKS